MFDLSKRLQIVAKNVEALGPASISAYLLQAATELNSPKNRATIANVRRWLVMLSEVCDCFARSEGECACGAWDDHKTIAMPRLIEQFDEEFPHDQH